MAYLIPNDYKVNIQDVNVQQIINADETIRDKAQLAGEAEAQSYLKQKYNISREFQNITPYIPNTTYYTFQRVYLYGVEFNINTTYLINQTVNYQNYVYVCLSNTTGVPPSNPTVWKQLGKLNDIYFVTPPYTEFDYQKIYARNDYVYWNNKTYQCKMPTSLLDHDTALQYQYYQNLPLPNVAPDDKINGVQYWGTGNAYSTNKDVTDTTDWTNADNRDAQMVLYCCDIVLYHLHARIAPRNIPDLRVKRYDNAIEWLKQCASGDVTPNLPLLKPRQGNRIRFGGNVKQVNSY